MSRATVILAVVVVAILVGLVLLGRRSAEVPTHRIEQPVTLNGAADAGR